MSNAQAARIPTRSGPTFATLLGFALPVLFIVLWSSGYVMGKLALGYTGPFMLLSLRFGLAALVLLGFAVVTGAPWPKRASEWGHLAVVGLLMHVLQFVGVYEGMRQGLPSGIAGLLIGMMPLGTAVGAHLWLGERIGRWQGLGLLGGLAGVLLVVVGKPIGGGGLLPYALALMGLLGCVVGTLYQKRFCAGMDLRSGASIQMTVAAAVVLPLAGMFEGFAAQWSGELVFASLWLALVNSIGAFSLLFIMVRRGQASQAARLFYMIPGVSALMGFVLLGEHLPALALLGFGVSAAAVALGAAMPGAAAKAGSGPSGNLQRP